MVPGPGLESRIFENRDRLIWILSQRNIQLYQQMKFNTLEIAKRLILVKKYEKAKVLLRQLAKRDHAKAQLILGYLYHGAGR